MYFIVSLNFWWVLIKIYDLLIVLVNLVIMMIMMMVMITRKILFIDCSFYFNILFYSHLLSPFYRSLLFVLLFKIGSYLKCSLSQRFLVFGFLIQILFQNRIIGVQNILAIDLPAHLLIFIHSSSIYDIIRIFY